MKKKDLKAVSLLITYEEIGLFPRSFNRVLDRFLKQVFSDVELFVVQEYRFYRYLFLTTFQSLFLLFFVPFIVNFFAKNYLVRPLADFFWNTQQTEIFLNSYQQKRAFAELQDFEEKLYFESLISVQNRSSLQNKGHTQNTFLNEGSLKTKSLDLGPSSIPQTKGILQKQGVVSNNIIKPLNTTLLKKVIKKPIVSTNLIYNSKPFNLALATNVENNKKVLAKKKKFEWKKYFLINKPFFFINVNSSGKKNLINTVLPSSAVTDIQTKKVQENSTSPKALAFDPYLFKPSSYGETVNMDQSEILLFERSSNKAENKKKLSFELQERLQQKTIELAMRYNNQSIDSITNFFADLFSLVTLFYLLFAMEIQINITKSFLLEVFFGLDDSKKSLLILLTTDLLVGYHSPNIWELFFESIFNRYGIPESQTGIFLLVATLPVLLDVLFKYLIFRHLNRASPATVATYHAMIE